MSALLRRLGAWLLQCADRLERPEAEPLFDATAPQERLFHLRTRILCGYY